ncbi:MAG: hypothetical protein ABI835_01065 [Chloroflexota bacterium]
MYPFLSLTDVHLDTDLAQRLPRRLAYYHLALPIAQDAEGITVAMAHPDNPKVVSVIEAALGAQVIPVRSFAETIRQQLDRVWLSERPSDTVDTFAGLRVTHWARSVDGLERSSGYVLNLLAALGRETQVEQSTANEFAPAAELIIAFTGDQAPPEHLFRTQASLLIVQNPAKIQRVMLHVLRGHIPDYRVLDWLVPLAKQQEADVTLFMGVDGNPKKPLVSDLSSILMAQDKRKAHIAECRRMLSESGIAGRLRIRQETLLTAIRDELHERPYDLVAIAAEAYGDFAQQVGEIVRSTEAAFLVIKP